MSKYFSKVMNLMSSPNCLLWFSIVVLETLNFEWQCSQYPELNPTCGKARSQLKNMFGYWIMQLRESGLEDKVGRSREWVTRAGSGVTEQCVGGRRDDGAMTWTSGSLYGDSTITAWVSQVRWIPYGHNDWWAYATTNITIATVA